MKNTNGPRQKRAWISGTVLEDFESGPVIAVEPVGGAEPHEALPVLEDGENAHLGESFAIRQVVEEDRLPRTVGRLGGDLRRQRQ